MLKRSTKSLEAVYQRLIDRMAEAGFSGYDPYDGLNTRYALLRGTKLTRLICIYLHKFSPFNLRRIFGVKPSTQLQALAFIGLALLTWRREGDRRSLETIVAAIKKGSLREKFGFDCWESHGFPIQMRTGYRPVGIPDIVGNEACGRVLLKWGIEYNDEEAVEMARSFRDYLLAEFLVERNDGCFFKYKTYLPENHATYNASLLGAQYVMEVDEALGVSGHEKVIRNAFRFVCDRQQPEGYWNYSIDLDTGAEKPQVDFHQGFILDSLLRFIEVYGFEEPFLESYTRGLKFYREEQFLESGQGIYRWPRKWPVNIHNQAQGILTFSRASVLDQENLVIANRIADWTVAHMRHPDGHFFYLKYPLFTNKIPYIRWSDAAMAYAFAVYLERADEGIRSREGSR